MPRPISGAGASLSGDAAAARSSAGVGDGRAWCAGVTARAGGRADDGRRTRWSARASASAAPAAVAVGLGVAAAVGRASHSPRARAAIASRIADGKSDAYWRMSGVMPFSAAWSCSGVYLHGSMLPSLT